MSSKLQEARESAGYSLRELARLIPCEPKTLWAIEDAERQGKDRKIMLHIRVRLNKLLGTDYAA